MSTVDVSGLRSRLLSLSVLLSSAFTMNAYSVVTSTYKWEMMVGREKVHSENVKKRSYKESF